MEISFIIVNFKSQAYLSKCLDSIKKSASEFKYEIILINNDPEPLQTNFTEHSINIINTGENIGFGRACNLGATNAQGKILFFLNPDTEINFSTINPLLEALLDEGVAIAAPRLTLPGGTVQPWSSGKEITLMDILANNLGLAHSKKIWENEKKSLVDWVSGAAFAIKKIEFEKIKGFDENFFMYFEDVDLCKRIRQAGKKIILLPDMEVLHLGGKSSKDQTQQKDQYYQSQDYYFEKHFGKTTAFFLKFLRKCSILFS